MTVENNGTAAQVKEPTVPAQVTGAPDSQKTEPGKKEFTSDEAAALLKENVAMKRKFKAQEEAEAKAREEDAKAKGEFQKLHEAAQKKLSAINSRLIASEIKALAVHEGILDPDFCMLINNSSVSIDDEGNVTGAKEAVAQLKASKPTLFGKGLQEVPGVATPKAVAPAGSYKTWDDYAKAPEAERQVWAAKHPAAFQKLAEEAKNPKV